MVGIKATIYNQFDCSDVGVFLFANPEVWRKNDKNIQAPKKKKKFISNIPLVEDYDLGYILKKVGWKLIESSLIIEYVTEKNSYEIAGIKTISGSSCIDQIENIINLSAIARYYKENV